MPIYNLSCEDGTDRHCWKTIENDIPVRGLTKDQLADLVRDGSTIITKAQIEKSLVDINDEEKKELNEDGGVHFQYEVDTVCAPCGSDQTYDDEGNNISAL